MQTQLEWQLGSFLPSYFYLLTSQDTIDVTWRDSLQSSRRNPPPARPQLVFSLPPPPSTMVLNPHKLGVHKLLKHIPLNAIFDAPSKARLRKAVNIADLRLCAKQRAHKVS